MLRLLGVLAVVALVGIVVAGCGKKLDENKSLSEVETAAGRMSADQLRAEVMLYKEAITARQKEADEIAAKVQAIPAGEMLGENAKALKDDLERLQKSLSDLRDRYEICYATLKARKGNTKGLEL